VYHLSKRQAQADETRARIVDSARYIVLTASSPNEISIDAVAREAAVSRTTVYQRFGSKSNLLEALFDDMATRGRIADIAEAFAERDAVVAIDKFVATFGHFWTVERAAIRRLMALAVLDAELGRAHAARNARRRHGVMGLLQRLGDTKRLPHGKKLDELADVLLVLTSFDTFDALAGEERTPDAVVPMVQRLVRQALGVESH
jgi:AcrR family transcriptional regulator